MLYYAAEGTCAGLSRSSDSLRDIGQSKHQVRRCADCDRGDSAGRRIVDGTIAQEWLQQGLQEAEQRGEQRGLRQGLLSGIRLALKLKFGMAGVVLIPEIAKIENVDVLHTILDGIGLAATPDELRQLFPTARPDGGDFSR